MTHFSRLSPAGPVGFLGLSASIAFLAAGISLAPGNVRSQTADCREIIADMAAQQKMIGIFRALDFEVRNHFLIVASAMLSTYGEWNSKPENWATDTGVLRGSTEEFELEVIHIRRDIGRSKAISEEDLQRL
ncbi:MAG: hypothetical protein ACKVPY_09505, partial [Paracoccaceae bacterium]